MRMHDLLLSWNECLDQDTSSYLGGLLAAKSMQWRAVGTVIQLVSGIESGKSMIIASISCWELVF